MRNNTFSVDGSPSPVNLKAQDSIASIHSKNKSPNAKRSSQQEGSEDEGFESTESHCSTGSIRFETTLANDESPGLK